MDKWELRAEEKKAAREKQLKKRMLIGGGIFAAAAGIIIVAAIATAGASGKKQETSEEKSEISSIESSAESVLESIISSDTSSVEESTESSVESSEETSEAESSSSETVEESSTADPLTATVETISTDPAPNGSGFEVDASRTSWNYDSNGEKTVYLTFDDGPSGLTPKVLDILDQYGIKATFFVTGQVPEYYSYIKEAYDRGHTIGLHSYSHSYAQIYTSVDAYLNDLNAIAQVVKDQIGYVPCFVRFPGGSSNEGSKEYCTGIMTALTSIVQSRGFQYWDWNCASGDGENVTAAQELENIKEIDGNTTNVIVLLHDGGGKQATVEALPGIIEYFKSQGYTFKALDRNTRVEHHTIFN